MMKTIRNTLVIAFLSAAILGCKDNNIKNQKSIGISTKSEIGLIQYGVFKNGKVAFVALTISRKKVEETQGIVFFDSDSYYLKIPEGETIRLPSSDQLFECIDGKFSSAKLDISEEILTKYLDKRYEINSIEKIIEFSKKMEK